MKPRKRNGKSMDGDVFYAMHWSWINSLLPPRGFDNPSLSMTMLSKLLYGSNPPTAVDPAEATESSYDRQKPLRIIHAGGIVECYYMAIPAATIIDKHPRSVLARPDVFRKPWESVVHRDEIMKPGKKFYVVPRRTVRKLQKRPWQRPPRILPAEESGSESVISSKYKEPKIIMKRSFRKNMSSADNNDGQLAAQVKIQRKKKVRFVDLWRPSLVSIDESSPVADL